MFFVRSSAASFSKNGTAMALLGRRSIGSTHGKATGYMTTYYVRLTVFLRTPNKFERIKVGCRILTALKHPRRLYLVVS